MNRAPVVCAGEPLIAMVATRPGPWTEASEFRRHVVGAESNVAIGLARLGHATAMVARVGGDGFGRVVLGALRAEGVDTSAVTVDHGHATALMCRERRGLGPSEVAYYRAGSAGSRLGPDDVASAAAFSDAPWVHLSGVTPALSVSCRGAFSAAVDAAAGRLSLDVNHRRRLWSDEAARAWLIPALARCATVFADPAEAELLTGEPDWPAAAAALCGLGAAEAVIKLGEEGAVLVRGGAEVARAPGYDVTVVDPVGAGDAFVAGFLSARLEGLDDAASLARGNACGAHVIAVEGDTTGAPTRAELARLGTSGDSIR